jgi:LytS/YehU family sensor histidine kinase
VDARALDCEVPSLLLQPLVENAVLHGVAPRPAGGRVRIATALNDGRLTIEVEDDGVGIANGAMDANGFGLRSVRDRLRMLGPGHDLVLESPARGGTLVRVTVPATSAHSDISQQ